MKAYFTVEQPLNTIAFAYEPERNSLDDKMSYTQTKTRTSFPYVAVQKYFTAGDAAKMYELANKCTGRTHAKIESVNGGFYFQMRFATSDFSEGMQELEKILKS